MYIRRINWNSSIKFRRNDSAEFASRWKRELYPASIADGKDAAYEISQRLKYENSLEKARERNKYDIDTGKGFSDRAKKDLNNKIANSKNKGSFTKKSEEKERQPRAKRKISKPKSSSNKFAKNYLNRDIPDPWETPPRPQKSLADRKKELADNIKKSISEGQEKINNAPPRPRPKVEYKSLNIKPRSKLEILGSDLKKVGNLLRKNKGKLALAGTLGAMGYGAYRKMRSDKGKKRRFYNR